MYVLQLIRRAFTMLITKSFSLMVPTCESFCVSWLLYILVMDFLFGFSSLCIVHFVWVLDILRRDIDTEVKIEFVPGNAHASSSLRPLVWGS